MGKVTYRGYYPKGVKPGQQHSVVFTLAGFEATLDELPPLPPTPEARHAALMAIIFAGPVERTADEQAAFDALKAAVMADVIANPIQRTPELQALLDASNARMAKEMQIVWVKPETD